MNNEQLPPLVLTEEEQRQHTLHHELVEWFAYAMRPHTYVEIGANHGNTFNRVSPLVERAVAVEKKAGTAKDIERRRNVEVHISTSDDFAKLWRDEINLLFIDADHSHEQSLRDFLHFSKFVPEDGLILLDDTCPPRVEFLRPKYCHDAYKTAWFIRTELGDAFEITTLPIKEGISVVRRTSRPLYWSDDIPQRVRFRSSTSMLLIGLLGQFPFLWLREKIRPRTRLRRFFRLLVRK